MSKFELTRPVSGEGAEILGREALRFVADLARRFEPERSRLLAARRERQARIDAGELPDFLPETRHVRESEWTVAPIPRDLQDRRVEITGPVDRKMIINALNSGANVFMADFEDSNSPTWENTVQGQVNLRHAVRRTIAFRSPEGKDYALAERTAVLFVRPRGWHLVEKHATIDGRPVSASLFDFGLFFFHNARELMARGTGPYFYLPKIESHREARLWNDVFLAAQDALGIPRGTIRATVLLETILAAFEMDEILHELREHSAGLNCGRWDYIFSVIKKFRRHPRFVLPDRAEITMDRAFLKAYVDLLIRTCHRRGIHAMGGMAAQIPIKGDAAANEAALEKVRADKRREVSAGHDGTWVAHPGLVPIAKGIFDAGMPGPNQIGSTNGGGPSAAPKAAPTYTAPPATTVATSPRAAPSPRASTSPRAATSPTSAEPITAEDLLAVPPGTITERGLRHNIDVGLQYLEAWLRGSGCVPIYNLMEDAATAEISRSQVWQWIRHGAALADGRRVTRELAAKTIEEEVDRIRLSIGDAAFRAGRYEAAARIFEAMTSSEEFPEFLTLVAYDLID